MSKQTEHIVYQSDNKTAIGHIYGADIYDLTYTLKCINEWCNASYTGIASKFTDPRRIELYCTNKTGTDVFIMRKVRK